MPELLPTVAESEEAPAPTTPPRKPRKRPQSSPLFPRKPDIIQGPLRFQVQDALLAAYERVGSITRAAAEVGIARVNHTYWLESDPTYVERWEAANEGLTQNLESAAVTRATTGAMRGVWYQGVRVGEEPWYSDNLLMFLLKARRRSTYGDQQAITGPDGGPVQVQAVRPDSLSRLTTSQLDALAALNGVQVAGLLEAAPAASGELADAIAADDAAQAEPVLEGDAPGEPSPTETLGNSHKAKVENT